MNKVNKYVSQYVQTVIEFTLYGENKLRHMSL